MAEQWEVVKEEKAPPQGAWEVADEIPIPKSAQERSGFLKRLGQSLGLPTSSEELAGAAKELGIAAAGTLISPMAPAIQQNKAYMENLYQAGKESFGEAREAGENIAEGGPLGANIGKAGMAAAHLGLQAVPFVGAPIETAGIDIAQGNIPGAAGGLTGAVAQIAALRGGPKLKEADIGLQRGIEFNRAQQQLKKLETQRNNLSAALEMGGKPERTLTFEEISPVMVPEVRAEAARQGVKPSKFMGRQGYELGTKLVSDVKKNFDTGYKELIEPVSDRPASNLARQAANELAESITSDPVMVETLRHQGKMEAAQKVVNRLQTAETIADLDAARIALNELGYGSSGTLAKTARQGATAVRNSLYAELERLYQGKVTEAQIRDFQKRHGMAIEADNLMQDTRKYVSSVASEEASPHTPFARARGSAYRGTMSPRHAVGGIIERLWGPKEIELFNTRMRRVLEGTEAPQPFKGLYPEGGPMPPPASVTRPAAIPQPTRPQQSPTQPAPAAPAAPAEATPDLPIPYSGSPLGRVSVKQTTVTPEAWRENIRNVGRRNQAIKDLKAGKGDIPESERQFIEAQTGEKLDATGGPERALVKLRAQAQGKTPETGEKRAPATPVRTEEPVASPKPPEVVQEAPKTTIQEPLQAQGAIVEPQPIPETPKEPVKPSSAGEKIKAKAESEGRVIPARKRKVFIGMKGQRDIVFPDEAHANLFSFKNELSRRMRRADKGIAQSGKINTDALVKQFGVADSRELYKLSADYYKEVMDAARSAEEGSVVKAKKKKKD